ncbi:hypothetical protein GLOTRDRAFT_78098 [Gloeophyllum trabeum ATCC 11539]|uniref:very-long-chain enoyl-CoA reductase n=1 Tax=Gloeophyllum trabeum (strain ATCC 11539 / FP-39264 / Madison 617) TaxID=670483 RepID=S7Q3M5_GLOTA|nr:uncharacterized protein GLOTRDRAFT_78098 [Gloeophyllum trabeum ATCC 11539]EPQ54162.1 hypothetical protein GLOTRDRAFT_78098 [Gloeophyllum trabeum ATCC 11539]
MVSITVSAAGKPLSVARGLPVDLDIPNKNAEDVTVADIKQALAAKFPKLYAFRQKITLKGQTKMLSDDMKIAEAAGGPVNEVSVKDLGPQISWRTVFLVEYAGPMVIHPLIYHLPRLFYGGPVQHSLLQQYVYGLVMLHFAKRELETLFVHRFSHDTMPARNILKNSAHYHLLSGLALAYAIYSPTYSAASPYIRGTIRDDLRFIWGCTALWLFSELSNLSTHLTLRNLRPPGTRQRAIPYGYGFNLVSCPNYFFECLAWTSVAAMTGSWVAWIFVLVSTGQMAQWAIKKHRGYRKEFGDKYPRGRKVMFPFVF